MDSQVTSSDTEQAFWSIEKILQTLDCGPKPDRPEAIRQARLQRDAIVPPLIEAIENAVAAVKSDHLPEGDVHFFALFLLTEFKAKDSLPAILEAVSLPDDGDYDLFGDAVTEYLYITFSTLADESFDQIEQLILNESIDSFVRSAAIRSYLNLFHRGVVTREQVIYKLRGYLETAISTSDWELATNLVSELVSYSPAEVLPTIEQAFEADLVDESVIDWDYVEMSVAEGAEYTQQEVERHAWSEPPDTIEYLEKWYCAFRDPEPYRRQEPLQLPEHLLADEYYVDDFEEDYRSPAVETIRNSTPRVGRNDPCICGSGKKFKKCCGKT